MAGAVEKLSASESNRIRELIAARGLIPVARQLRMAPQTVVKIAAEMPISRALATHARVEIQLQK